MLKLNKENVYDNIKEQEDVFSIIKSSLNFIEENKNSLVILSVLCELNMLNSKQIVSNVDEKEKNVMVFSSMTQDYYDMFKGEEYTDKSGEITKEKQKIIDYYYLKNIIILLDNIMYVTGKFIKCEIIEPNGDFNGDIIFQELLLDFLMGEYQEVEVKKIKTLGLGNKRGEIINKFDNYNSILENVSGIDELLDNV